MDTNKSHIVRGPRPTRCELARRAKAAGMTPQAFLAPVLSRHETLASAGVELGVSERTIINWMHRYDIVVEREAVPA